jgi:hypothetical protein
MVWMGVAGAARSAAAVLLQIPPCMGPFALFPSSFLSLLQPAPFWIWATQIPPFLMLSSRPPAALVGLLTSNFLIARSLKLLTPPNAPTPCVLAGWRAPACLPAARLLCGRSLLLPLCPSEKSEPGVQLRCGGGGACRCVNVHTIFHPVFFGQPSCNFMATSSEGAGQGATLQGK